MKKKVIGLSTLLLVLLLGLFSNAYADSQRVWTLADLNNVVYNNCMLAGDFNTTSAQNYVNNHQTEIETLLNKINNSDNVYVIRRTGSGYYPLIVGYGNGNPLFYRGSNGLLYHSSNVSGWKYTEFLYDGLIREQNGFYTSGSFRTDFCYFSSAVRSSNDLTATILFSAGSYTPSTFFEGLWVNEFFDYFYNSNLDNLTVPKVLDTIKSMSYSQFRTEYVAEVGMLKFLDTVSVGQFYWDNSINDWKLLRSSNNYIVNNDTTSENFLEVYCPQNWWYGNTLLAFEAVSKFDADVGGVLDFWVYLTDNNTIINNGVLQIGSFSGDYDNNIQNDIQHDQTIDAINDINDTITDDSEVDNIISTMPTSSGDVANSFGYLPIENPFTTFLLNLVQRFYTTLTSRNKEYLNLNHHGSTTWTIDTDKFITPDGTLKTLIRTLLVFLWIFGNYKYFHYLITLLQTARIDKAITELGTDEFYDSDIM